MLLPQPSSSQLLPSGGKNRFFWPDRSQNYTWRRGGGGFVLLSAAILPEIPSGSVREKKIYKNDGSGKAKASALRGAPKPGHGDHQQLGAAGSGRGRVHGWGTPLPLQTQNPTECLAEARDLPSHTGKQSCAFAAAAKQVSPLQRAPGTSLVLGETARGVLCCSMGAAEIPKIPFLMEHILQEMSSALFPLLGVSLALFPLFGVVLGCPCWLWVLGGTSEGWGWQGWRGWRCS